MQWSRVPGRHGFRHRHGRQRLHTWARWMFVGGAAAALLGVIARRQCRGGESGSADDDRVNDLAGAQADDQAGASPDEALADAAAGPHADTTPDHPAAIIDIEDPDEPEPWNGAALNSADNEASPAPGSHWPTADDLAGNSERPAP